MNINHRDFFLNQFIIGPKTSGEYGFDHHTKINQLYINHYERDDFVVVLDSEGEVLGLIIGYPIDYKNKVVIKDRLILDVSGDLDKAVEDTIYALSGSFIFILDHDEQRIYLDTNGSLSIVYDYQSGLIGSTASVILSECEYSSRFNWELFNHLNLEKDGWFPSGLTAHKQVNRLLCNHYLDVRTLAVKRHWPQSSFVSSCSAEACGEGITKIIRDTVEAISKHGSVICALTAGNETRLITSALHGQPVNVDYFTIDFEKSSCDMFAAERISNRLGLNWKSIRAQYSSEVEKEVWLKQVAHCIFGNNLYIHKSLKSISDYDFFVGGLGGEIGRAFIWRASDSNETKLTVDSIIKRFGLPSDNVELRSATEQWLEGCKRFDALTILELAYIELRMSAWAFSQSYADPKKQVEINPMVCREAYLLMLSLNPEDKKSGSFIMEGVKINCPELLDIPINKYGDYRDYVFLFKKLSLGNVVKKIRKIFG